MSLIKQKCKLNVANLNFFVGLDEFKAYLHNSLNKFCLNESLANKNLIKLENSKFANKNNETSSDNNSTRSMTKEYSSFILNNNLMGQQIKRFLRESYSANDINKVLVLFC